MASLLALPFLVQHRFKVGVGSGLAAHEQWARLSGEHPPQPKTAILLAGELGLGRVREALLFTNQLLYR